MPMPMKRPEPLKGSTQGQGGARLLDDGDVNALTAQAEEDEEEKKRKKEEDGEIT